jgi:hypothetical protein
MGVLEKALNKVDGYLLSIKRNTIKGSYEIEVGIPKTWAYKSTDKIECEVIHETKQGDIVKISANKEDVVIDDLIKFVNIIIETNQRIAKMQEDFDKQLEKAKQDLEDQVKSFYEKVDEMKESSFEEMEKKQNEIGELKKEIEKKTSTHKKQKEKFEDDLKKELETKLSK